MKHTFGFKKLFKGKYNQLLVILISMYGLSPFLEGTPANMVLSIVFLYAFILIARTFAIKPKLLRLYSYVALIALMLALIGRLGWGESWIVTYAVLIQFVYAIYFGLALYWILQDILSAEKITQDLIRGGVCAYLLIGFLWGLLYGITASVNPNAFSEPIIVEEESFSRMIYFSFTTFTTLGYGDILPVTSVAKMLTNFEAIIGQLYPAIFIARLVSDYMSDKPK